MKGYSKMQLIDESPTSTRSTPPTSSNSQYDDYNNHHELQQKEEDKSFPNATSSIPDTRFNREKKISSNLQTTVKKAFSMRRSSSISEKYYRIHDHSLNLQSECEDEEESQVKGSTNKKGSVLKACKRIFRI
ncbi:unnamed protein product [Lactuca saligna]|uniref:Uncharacterized protein n=1 Tax=Lactuca saligna TaxID=75948 RepID=A0AA36EI36_LACSI|nr:unnamed protein product [Lactuca saligna]